MEIFKVCRLCYCRESGPPMISLFEDDGKLKSNFELCTGISLYDDHIKKMPALICISCLESLNNFSKIRNNAREIEVQIQLLKRTTVNIQQTHPIANPVSAPQAKQTDKPNPIKEQLLKLPPSITITSISKPKSDEAKVQLNTVINELNKKKQRTGKQRQRMIPDMARNQFTSLRRVPFLLRNLRKFGVTINCNEKYTETIAPLITKLELATPVNTAQGSLQKAYNTRHKPMKKFYPGENNVVIKRKNTKRAKPAEGKVAKKRVVRYNNKIKSQKAVNVQSSQELPSDHEMNIILDKLKDDQDNMMDTLENPSLLPASIDSTVPIDMELDLELSGPPPIAEDNKTYVCPVCQRTWFDSALELIRHLAQDHPEEHFQQDFQ